MSTAVEVATLPYCDFCPARGSSTVALYDGKTVFGPWAHMCEACFRRVGVGLGTGVGQRLVYVSWSRRAVARRTDGFILAYFPTVEEADAFRAKTGIPMSETVSALL